MSRAQHDQFIDDEEEETCPLCVEEFDLSDKNFRPCPCGYQVRDSKQTIFFSDGICLDSMLTLRAPDMPVLLQ